MPQVLAWKCDHTGKLFATKSEYRAHLIVLARQSIATKRRNAFLVIFDEQIKELRKASSFEQIASWVQENFDLFVARNPPSWGHRTEKQRRKAPQNQIISMSFHNMRLGKAPWWVRHPVNLVASLGWVGELHYDAMGDVETSTFKGSGLVLGSGGGHDIPSHTRPRNSVPIMRRRYGVFVPDQYFPMIRLMEKMKGDSECED